MVWIIVGSCQTSLQLFEANDFVREDVHCITGAYVLPSRLWVLLAYTSIVWWLHPHTNDYSVSDVNPYLVLALCNEMNKHTTWACKISSYCPSKKIMRVNRDCPTVPCERCIIDETIRQVESLVRLDGLVAIFGSRPVLSIWFLRRWMLNLYNSIFS